MLTTELKNKTLKSLAGLIRKNADQIIERNQQDLTRAVDLDPTLVDRLKVDTKKVEGMAQSVEAVWEAEDPQGKLLYSFTHPNGMLVENRVVPSGGS